MLCNNFIFRSYTGRALTMEMPTDSPGTLRRHSDSAPDRFTHRLSRFLSVLISHLTRSRPVARRMLTWSPYTRVKTGWLNSMIICLNRLLLLVILFVFQLSSERTLTALYSTHGFRQGSFPHGMRQRDYIRNFAQCGIIVTISRWTTTELFGGSVVHIVPYYSYWYLNLVENSFS